MKFDNLQIRAHPTFHAVCCPKHGTEMVEIDNGWFSICWYCKDCKYPYELQLVKMCNVNKKNLKKALEEKENSKVD